MQAMKIKLNKYWNIRLDLWATQWTPIENGALVSLIFFITLVLPPWKIKATFAPKHNNFLATSSLVNPTFQQFNHDDFNKIVRARPIHIPFNTKQYKKPNPKTNHGNMNTYPWTIINGYNFITWVGYESSRLNGLDNGILNMNSIRTQLTISYQCMFGLFKTTKLLKSSYKLSYSNLGRPWDKTCKIYFIYIIFQFPSFANLFVPKHIKNPSEHTITCFSNEIMCNVFPTFFHPQLWHILC
jgi:hypothetical protein